MGSLPGVEFGIIDEGAVGRAGIGDVYARIGDFNFSMRTGYVWIGDHQIVIGAASEFVFSRGEWKLVSAVNQSCDWPFGNGDGGRSRGATRHCGLSLVGFARQTESEFKTAEADGFAVVHGLLLPGGEAGFAYFCAVGGADIFYGDASLPHLDLSVTATDSGVLNGDIALSSDDGDSRAEDVFPSGRIDENGELDGRSTEGVAI
ncbi:MAG: hypothetical protein R2688_01860 [Fimbriimonadaceae bacterium]